MFQDLFRRLTVGTQLLFVVFIGIVTQGIAAMAMSGLPLSTEYLLARQVVFNTLLILLPPLLLIQWRGEVVNDSLQLIPVKNLKLWLSGLLILPLLLPIGDWIATFFHNLESVPEWYSSLRVQQEGTEQFIDTIFNGSEAIRVLGFVILVIFAPISEELYFRGMLQRMFYRIMPTWMAIVLPAFLFTLVHYQIDNVVSIFILALALGWIYHRTRQLWITVLGHLLFNGITYAFEAHWIEQPTSLDFALTTGTLAVVFLLMVPKLPLKISPQPQKPSSDTPE